MAGFREVFKCIGVDADIASNASMMVPLHGSNIIAVIDGAGLKLVPDRPQVKIKEFFDKSGALGIVRKSLHDVMIHLDKQAAEALAPDLWTGQARFFEVSATGRIDKPGVAVSFHGGSSRDKNGTLQVVAGDKLVFRLAIRNIKVVEMDGTPRTHSTKPGNANEELAVINAVWTPQTNIAFELVSETAVTIDLRQQDTREALGKAYGTSASSNDSLSNQLYASQLKDVMVGLMTELERTEGKKPDFTVFKVHTVLSGGTPHNPDRVDGTTVRDGRYAFVGNTRGTTTMAHEIGHFLAGPYGWGDKDHHVAHPATQSIVPLMRDGGAGWKIPFADTVGKFRPFVEQTIRAR